MQNLTNIMKLKIFIIIILITYLIVVNSSMAAPLSPPRIREFSFPKRVVDGETVPITCALETPITAQTEFKWLKNGVDISLIVQRDKRFEIVPAHGASVLIIKSVTLEDFGNYTCVVNSPWGADKFTASLTIYTRPKWILELFDLSMKKGQVRIADCMASGNPPPTISWLFSESSQGMESFIPVSVSHQTRGLTSLENGSLIIDSSKLMMKDSSMHLQCMADNKIGEAIRKTIKLSMIVPAQFSDQIGNFSVYEVRKGEKATLRCPAHGDHPLQVKWLRQGKDIDFNNLLSYEHQETLTDRGLNSELIISSLDRADGGLYSCEVKNNHAHVVRTIKIVVQEVPEAPNDLSVPNKWPRSASIKWSTPFDGNSVITSYLVHYWKNDKTLDMNRKLNEVKVEASKTSYTLTDLQPGSPYIITVTAVNAIGSSASSRPVLFHTTEEEPSAAPRDIVIKPKGASVLQINWKSPPRDKWNGNITGYYIQYKPNGNTQDFIKTVQASLHSDIREGYKYLLTGLQRSTYYRISVKAYNAVGPGPASQEFLVETLEGDVPVAPHLRDPQITPRYVKIQWTPIKDDVVVYTVYIKRKYAPEYESVLPLASLVFTYTIYGLKSDEDYSVQVSASNIYGESDLSEPLQINIPSSPLGLSLLLAEGNLVLLSIVLVSLVTVITVIVTARIYVKKFRKKQRESFRRLSSLSSIPRENLRCSDKYGTTRSTATYATIGPPTGHVTIRSAGSNSHSSSSGYGRNHAEIDDINKAYFCGDPGTRRISRQSKGSLKKCGYDEVSHEDIID